MTVMSPQGEKSITQVAEKIPEEPKSAAKTNRFDDAKSLRSHLSRKSGRIGRQAQ